MKRSKKVGRRRSSVDLIALEGTFGRRLRRIEEALNLRSRWSSSVALAVIFVMDPKPGAPEREGVTTDPKTGSPLGGQYRLGPYRQITFFGPRGGTVPEAERRHREIVATMLAEHPEFAQPCPAPRRAVEGLGVRITLGNSAEAITPVLITRN